MHKRIIGTLLLSMTAAVSASPKYISLEPLTSKLSNSHSPVKAAACKELPIITWGGDINTIYANGSSLSTQANSLIGKAGLCFKLSRADSFPQQVARYKSGETPYLRGTMGMIALASDAIKDPALKPVIFHQLTWSAGGDALVVKSNISKIKQLKNKTIALQAYGPHVDYLIKLLSDAGLTLNDVTIKWLPDLTGSKNSPPEAMYEKNIDAAFMTTPDALALTSGHIGTGAEGSIKGAKILISTKSAPRIIADVYAVRADYYKANPIEVESLTRALLEAQNKVAQLLKTKDKKADTLIKAAAKFLLDSELARDDLLGLYSDAEHTDLAQSQSFFQNKNDRRNAKRIYQEAAVGLSKAGIISGNNAPKYANFDYSQFGKVEQRYKSTFNAKQVNSVVAKKKQQGSLDDSELFSFEVFFKPNQKTFTSALYQTEFERVIDLAATYGGAVITIEGHSDVMGYLRRKQAGSNSNILSRIKQSAKNLSLNRAQSVRDSIIEYAKLQHVSLDPNQFAIDGNGISQPKTGICGIDPCAPQTAKQWRSNMRVQFRLIQVETEADVFIPLNAGGS